MLNKKDLIFYAIAGNVIAVIAGVAGASLPVILFLSLIIPPGYFANHQNYPLKQNMDRFSHKLVSDDR